MILDFRVQIPRERRATHRPGYMLRYRDVFDLDAVSYDEEQLLAQLEAAGIDRAVIQAEWSAGDYRAQTDVAAGLAQRYPERFCAFASVNPGDGPSAVYELIRAVEELEMRGLNVQPFAAELRANDRRLYPLYWKCLEYGVPVTIHTGINYSATRTMDYGRPLYVDQVACDFPGLVIVLNHGGWPWVHESVAMARKHPQIFVETGGIAPKYLAKPNSGWEVFSPSRTICCKTKSSSQPIR